MKKRIFSVLLALLVVFTLVACGDKKPEVDENQQKLDDVHSLLDGIISNPDTIVSDLTLPATFQGGVTGTWKSSNEDVLEIQESVGATVKGLVKRPDFVTGDQKVTLSIDLTLEVEGKDDLVKNWSKELTVIKLDEIKGAYTSIDKLFDDIIAEKLPIGKDFKTDLVTVEGVTLYGSMSNGYYLATEDGSLAYVNGTSDMPEKGKVFNITAKGNNYHGALQLADVNYTEVEKNMTPAVVYKETTFEALNKIITKDEGGMVGSPTFKLKDVKLYIVPAVTDVRYNLIVVPKDFDPKTAIKNTNGDYFVESMMLYYPVHDFETLKSLVGLEISELEFVYEGYRDDKFVRYGSVLTLDNVKLAKELTDEDKLESAKDTLTLQTEVVKEATFDFTESGVFGTTITWKFKDNTNADNTLVNLETGKVTLPELGKSAKVTVVATIELGDKSVTKEFIIDITNYVEVTIAQFLAYENKLKGKITGVITDMYSNNTYGITDESGSIAVYSKDKLDIGKKYTLVGAKGGQNGNVEITDVTLMASEAGEIPEPFAIDSLLGNNDELKKHIGRRVSIEGAVVDKVFIDETFGNIEVTLKKNDVTIVVRYDSRVKDADITQLDLELGDVVNYVGNLGWYKNPQLGFGPNTHLGEGWPVEEEIELPYTIDFGSENKTGYNAGDLEFTNGDGKKYTIKKDRAQLNTSNTDGVKDLGPMLILAPKFDSKSDLTLSYAEFDFDKFDGMKKISFGISTWNDFAYDNATALEGSSIRLEQWNGTAWIALKDSNNQTNIFGSLVKSEFTEVSFAVTNPGKYRIVYETPNATSTSNTAYAVTVNKMVIS